MKYVRTFEQFINEKYDLLIESNINILSPEMGGSGPDPKGFLKIIWELSIKELETLLSKSQDDLKWLKANSRGTLGAFNRKDAQFVTSRISLINDLIKRKKKDPNVEKPDWLKESTDTSQIFEASDITPERMLRSVYDRLKDVKSIKVGKINNANLTFDFEIDVKNYMRPIKNNLIGILDGQVEARQGKILISFSEVKIYPAQYDITFDGETTMSKDYTRDKAIETIRNYVFKFRQ
jgi:hypothetical protein